MLINLQKLYAVPNASLTPFLRNLKRRLRLGSREFNICLVDNKVIRRLNSAYRSEDKATDVLSFPWHETAQPQRPERRLPSRRRAWGETTNFLGEVVISIEMARRNARGEGHSTLNEIRWLILHGVLHLLGYDHERDSGEMTAREWALREQLGVADGTPTKDKSKGKRQKSKVKSEQTKANAEVV